MISGGGDEQQLRAYLELMEDELDEDYLTDDGEQDEDDEVCECTSY